MPNCPICNSFFVRSPCPDCGYKEEKEKMEQEEEKMVKPSELKGGSAVNPSAIPEEVKEEEASLLKPSEYLKSKEDSVNKEEIENLRKPSEMFGIKTEEKTQTESLRKPSEMIDKEKEIVEEESLRKPSEMFKDESEDLDDIEHLRKPSEMFTEKTGSEAKATEVSLRKPSEVTKQKGVIVGRHDSEDSLLKPSQLGGKSGAKSVVPQEVKKVERSKTTSGETLLRPSELGGTSGRGTIATLDQKKGIKSATGELRGINTKDGNDKRFRKDVKQTLEEVINLLEELIED